MNITWADFVLLPSENGSVILNIFSSWKHILLPGWQFFVLVKMIQVPEQISVEQHVVHRLGFLEVKKGEESNWKGTCRDSEGVIADLLKIVWLLVLTLSKVLS